MQTWHRSLLGTLGSLSQNTSHPRHYAITSTAINQHNNIPPPSIAVAFNIYLAAYPKRQVNDPLLDDELTVPSPASNFVGIPSPATNRRSIQFSSASSVDSRTNQVDWTNICGAASRQRGKKFGVFELSVPSPASNFVGIPFPAANYTSIHFSSASSFDSRTDQVIWTNIRGAVSCQRGQ